MPTNKFTLLALLKAAKAVKAQTVKPAVLPFTVAIKPANADKAQAAA